MSTTKKILNAFLLVPVTILTMAFIAVYAIIVMTFRLFGVDLLEDQRHQDPLSFQQ